MNTKAQEYLDNLYIADAKNMIDFLQSRSKYRGIFDRGIFDRGIFDRGIFDRAKICNVKNYLHNLAVK